MPQFIALILRQSFRKKVNREIRPTKANRFAIWWVWATIGMELYSNVGPTTDEICPAWFVCQKADASDAIVPFLGTGPVSLILNVGKLMKIGILIQNDNSTASFQEYFFYQAPQKKRLSRPGLSNYNGVMCYAARFYRHYIR
jgi:hypothetical protein